METLLYTMAVIIIQVSSQSVPPITKVPVEDWVDDISTWETTIPERPDFEVNTALLTVKSLLADNIVDIYWQHQQCFGCEVQFGGKVPTPNGNLTLLIHSDYGSTIEIRETLPSAAPTVACRSDLGALRERGVYWLIVDRDPATSSDVICNIVLTNDPPNYNLPVLYAFLVLAGLAIIYIIIKKLYIHDKCTCKDRRHNSHDINSSSVALEMNGNISLSNIKTEISQNELDQAKNPQQSVPALPRRRLVSLDTFRGLSLVIMIFVNYGGGGYWYFQHAHWDGLLVADLVFPWFTWIMGTSIAFAFRGMLKRNTPKWRIFLKILYRSCMLFAIGLFMMSRNSPDVNKLRIPGVLQRLAFTYFITASVHLGFAHADEKPKYSRAFRSCPSLADVLDFWPEWILMLAILGLQIGLTYGLPVPGCPMGYVGPGGLHDGGKYYNCTGGAAGYIDKWILSYNHIYQWPTIKALYKTQMAFDPEGVLGTLTSIFMCFLGLQAGKIIMTHRAPLGRSVRLIVWGIITGVIGTVLCQAKQTGGWVPLNKNLWSVSFILVLTSMAFFLLLFLYLIIDVAQLWTGAPFKYPGMNSIVIYVCQSVFSTYFPLSWQWPDYTLHWQQLFRAIWGCVVWTLLAYVMYAKKTFIAL